MKIRRQEGWGTLIYDTIEHEFIVIETETKDSLPYIGDKPVVLNIDLTFDCNMNCKHCVAKDAQRIIERDLVINSKLTSWLKHSPFMVFVITGGEPLLPEKESNLLDLISNINGGGLVIDTNGTIVPSKKVLAEIIRKNILLRVSMDSVNPNEEIALRKVRDTQTDLGAYYTKLKNIHLFQSKGITVSIQSVLSLRNKSSVTDMPKFLMKNSIKRWHIQRFIPSNRAIEPEKYALSDADYQATIESLQHICNNSGIKLFGKRDRRHNSVFLLAGDGDLYTQGSQPGQKIYLGNIDTDVRYFDYVSSADHSARYYGTRAKTF